VLLDNSRRWLLRQQASSYVPFISILVNLRNIDITTKMEDAIINSLIDLNFSEFRRLVEQSGLRSLDLINHVEDLDIVGYLIHRSTMEVHDLDKVIKEQGYSNYVHYIRAILDYIADNKLVNYIKRYENGETLFHMLARSGEETYVSPIERMFDPEDIKCYINLFSYTTGSPPIHEVFLPRDVGMFNSLVRMGANPYVYDVNGLNLVAKVYTRPDASLPLSYLNGLGYSPYAPVDTKGNTLLHLSITIMGKGGSKFLYNQLKQASALIPLVNVVNAKLQTPLMLACKYGLHDVLLELNSLGAWLTLEEKDLKGNTCLHYVVNVSTAVDVLLKMGAPSLEVKNKEGKTPLDVAIDKGNKELIKYYLRFMETVDEKHYALLDEDMRRRINIIKKKARWQYLLENKRVTDIIDAFKEIGIDVCSTHPSMSCVEYLQRNFLDLLDRYIERWKQTHKAVQTTDSKGVPLYYYADEQLYMTTTGDHRYNIRTYQDLVDKKDENIQRRIQELKSKGKLGRKLKIASLMEKTFPLRLYAWQVIYRLGLKDELVDDLTSLNEEQSQAIVTIAKVMGLKTVSTSNLLPSLAEALKVRLDKSLKKRIATEIDAVLT
jgi:ankyrin repeat protein